MLEVVGFVWSCLALSIDIWIGFHVDSSLLHDVLACSCRIHHQSQPDPTNSHGDGQHDSNTPIVSISATIPTHLVSEFDFRMLSFVYQQPFSGSLDPCPLLSLSTAASIYTH